MLLLLKHAAMLAALVACLGYSQAAFEAASVKPSPPTAGGRFSMAGGPGTADPGRITFSNIPLRIVLLNAYDVRNYQLIGPDWLNTLRYDITARIPEGAGKAQVQEMLRQLLETRFRLTLHRESKEMQVYALMAGKNGTRLKSTGEQSPEGEIATAGRDGADGFPKLSMPSPGIVMETRNGTARISGNQSPMAKLADFLSGRVGRPVIDHTSLAGNYNFVVYFTPEDAQPAGGNEPDLFGALQHQLGLRLEARREAVQLLVIDHAERIPTEN